MRVRSDAGAGSILAVAIVAAAVILALAMVGLGAGLVARQRTIGAADAAALAAADVLLGAAPGDPCGVAAELATANGATLLACGLDGYLATVTLRADLVGAPILAQSTAGPPPSR